MSADSLRRVTEGWGQAVAQMRAAEVEQAHAPVQLGESPRTRRVREVAPIEGQGNVSTDGAMVLLRDEGWKEVKLTTISQVHVAPASARSVGFSPSRRDQDPWVRLSQHSYQAGLWDADTMARYQYAEGLRRGLERCSRLSSVNDGASWILRITQLNYPKACPIIDWGHANERLWTVARDVFGEQSPETKAWAEQQVDHLWQGETGQVIHALDAVSRQASNPTETIRQSPDYFRTREAQMRYAEFRAQGYPIGSGTVESGANTVVHHRMKRPGRGWQRTNAHSMLAGLSELHSDRFDLAWQRTVSAAT